MLARMGEVVEAVRIDAQGAGRDLVQQRLPDVDQRAVDQRDPGLAVPAQPIAELGREHQAARAAADHDDVVRRCQDRVGTNSPRARPAPARAPTHPRPAHVQWSRHLGPSALLLVIAP